MRVSVGIGRSAALTAGPRAGTRRAAVLAALLLAGVAACTAGEDGPTPTPSGASSGSLDPSTVGPTATSPATTAGPAPSAPTEVPSAATAPPTFATDAPGRQDSVLARLPGSTKTGCLAVGSERDVRSGSMAAGNFAQARAMFAQDPTAKVPIYMIPSQTSGEPALTVRISRPDGSSATTVKTSLMETADIWRYWQVALPVPSAGTWRITASAGSSSGCWDVTFEG